MKKTIIWAATPEARKKLAAGYEPPKNDWNCTKMKNAQAQAEKAVKEIKEEGAEKEKQDTE